MEPNPHAPDSPAWRSGGRILVRGVDRGAGVAVHPRLVLTARHVISAGEPNAPVTFKAADGRDVAVISPIRFADGLDAAALKLADAVRWSAVANARSREDWWVKPTGTSNDPVLTGTVTATGLPLADAQGNRVTAMQLQVEQDLGGFMGYSGSAVLNEEGQVTGLLIEQMLQRLTAPRAPASNVLFALPIADVAERLNLDLDLARPAPGVLLREGFAPLIENYTRFFAGRDDVLRKLEQFMQTPEGGYLVITAPAGFGKTALVANLVSREPGRIAYHFFSRLYGTGGLDERFFLLDVVQQLTFLDGSERQLPESIEQLRALYHHLLSQPARASRVLVLDGLDEISGWDINPYLGRHLPVNIHVILTVRDVGQDWATDFGIPRDQAGHVQLTGLSREELGAALRNVGGQGDVLADDDILLDRVMQVAAYATDADLGADPFYVRFLLDDAAADRLTPESLAQQPGGVKAFLDQWWNELRALAGDEHAKDFFGSLTAALGPIGRADLAQINPSLRSTGGWDDDPLDTVLAKARRMVFGNDEAGYVLISPRLHAYARTKINTTTYADRILDYCSRWQENDSSYALAHYAQHLLQAGRTEDLYRLVRKAWIEARSRQSTYHAPAEDARLVIEVARSEQPPNLAQEVRHSLIYATLGSFTASLQSEAFHLLTQFGEEKEARAIASLLEDDESRIEAQIAIGTGLLARGDGEIARSELRRAMRVAEPGHLHELAPGMARLAHFDEVESAIARVGDQDLRASAIAECAVALATDGQAENAIALTGKLNLAMPRIEALSHMTRALAQAHETGGALKAANIAAGLAGSVTEPEARARALALAARALALVGEGDRAGQVAAASLAALADASPDWRMMETVCMAAQVLAPRGQVEDSLRAADRIAQGVVATAAFIPTGHEVYGDWDLRIGTGSVERLDDEPADSSASEFQREMAQMRNAMERTDSVVAARPTFRNLASTVPDTGLVVVAPVTSADEVRTNAVSWVAQSLAEADASAEGSAIADSLLMALDQVSVEPTCVRAVAQGYVSLIIAKAGDEGRAASVVDDTFATLKSAQPDLTEYKYLLRAVAPALQLSGETEAAIGTIDNLAEFVNDESQRAQFKIVPLQSTARQLLAAGDFTSCMEFGFSLVTGAPQARADFLGEVIGKLRQDKDPDVTSTWIAAIAEIDEAFVQQIPPDAAQAVLTSAAGALAGIGEFDRAARLVERVLEIGVVAPADAYAKARSFTDVAEALHDVGATKKARTVMLATWHVIVDSQKDLEHRDLERLLVAAARVLDQLTNFDVAGELLSFLSEGWKNTSYALSDHAAALSLGGQFDEALSAAALIALPIIKASALSRIAMALATTGSRRADDVAAEALQLAREDRPASENAPTSWWTEAGDQEAKEGSWLLSRAVSTLPAAGAKTEFSNLVASAVAVAGTGDAPWARALGLGGVLQLILSGENDRAVLELTEIRARAAADPDDFQRTRNLRWVAELLIRLSETAAAQTIVAEISDWYEHRESPGPEQIDDTADIVRPEPDSIDVWVADILCRLSESLFAAGDDAAAAEAADAGANAVENIRVEAARLSAVDRLTRTYTAIGQHERALAGWHEALPAARSNGRPRLFEMLGAVAGALAAHDHGRTLWTIYEDVTEVEDWWDTVQLA